MSSYQTLLANIAKITKMHAISTPIEIVAISKYYPLEAILELYNQGVRAFGESRLQESLPKIAASPLDITWHFIGNLQKNKVRSVIQNFQLIHSVTSIELAEKIEEESEKLHLKTAILMQVNISEELSKNGFSVSALEKNFEKLIHFKSLHIKGLMTIAPLKAEEKKIRQTFANLRILRATLEKNYSYKLPYLSMGMSQDYPLAITEGANLLRIGSALFKS